MPRLKALTLKAIYIQIYYPQAWLFFKLTTQSIASYPGKTLTLQVSIWKHVLRNEQSPRDSKETKVIFKLFLFWQCNLHTK